MHDNVKDCLRELLEFNDSRNKGFFVTDDDGNRHDGTVKDLQELNTSDLYNLVDLLGMDDLYKQTPFEERANNESTK